VVWTGDSRLPNRNLRRSVPINQFLKIIDVPNVDFVSLQLNIKSHPFHDWTDDIDDFYDTAGLIQGLDLVITVDTSVVHLAGALGKPVWLLNRFDTCWRWLLDREDSPWYPTLRQFRQPKAGDWDSVMERVRTALMEKANVVDGNRIRD